MKTLLLTGFEPFLQFPINPTEKIVKELDGKKVGRYKIRGVLLPVDFTEGPNQAQKAFLETEPDAVISLGLAAGRTSITPERIAINCRDGEPDNRGVALEDAPIQEDGADGYFTTLPIRKIVQSLKAQGLPAEISNSAGTYLCNNVMYTILHEVRKGDKTIPAGFIHIPASHELAVESKKSMPSWPDADLLKAVKVIIETLD